MSAELADERGPSSRMKDVDALYPYLFWAADHRFSRCVPDNFRGRKFPTSDLKAFQMQDAKSEQKFWLNVAKLYVFGESTHNRPSRSGASSHYKRNRGQKQHEVRELENISKQVIH